MSSKANKILDKHVSSENFAKFSRCKSINSGRGVKFCYPSGDTYEVSLPRILSWFARPHYIRTVVGVKDWPADLAFTVNLEVRITSLRRVLRGHALRIYTTGGAIFDVAWDTVLMACEPRYEWFERAKRQWTLENSPTVEVEPRGIGVPCV